QSPGRCARSRLSGKRYRRAYFSRRDYGCHLDASPPAVSVEATVKGHEDEMALEAAVNGEADRLVTFNLRHAAGCRGIWRSGVDSARGFEGDYGSICEGEVWRFAYCRHCLKKHARCRRAKEWRSISSSIWPWPRRSPLSGRRTTFANGRAAPTWAKPNGF